MSVDKYSCIIVLLFICVQTAVYSRYGPGMREKAGLPLWVDAGMAGIVSWQNLAFHGRLWTYRIRPKPERSCISRLRSPVVRGGRSLD